MYRISKGRDPGEGIAFVENAANSAKHIWREMQAGECNIERIAKYRITGYRRSAKSARYPIEGITLNCHAEIWLEWEVLTINTTSSGVFSNCMVVVVESYAVGTEHPEAKLVTAEVTCRRRRWRSDFL